MFFRQRYRGLLLRVGLEASFGRYLSLFLSLSLSLLDEEVELVIRTAFKS